MIPRQYPSVLPSEPLLALDTSTDVGAVAVGRIATGPSGVPAPPSGAPGTASDDSAAGELRLDVLARAFLPGSRTHSALLLPTIAEVLEEAGVDRAELGGIVVGSGPGSFTGVRVAAATMKGLAHGLDVPVWAFSSLASAALAPDVLPPGIRVHPDDPPGAPLPEGREGDPRLILFDARGDRVYAACYRVRGSDLRILVEPRAAVIGDLLEGGELREGRDASPGIPRGTLLAGSGARRHRERVEAAGWTVLPSPAGRPTGDGLLRLLALAPDTPPLDRPGRWEPTYLKASSAERDGTG